ncbi:MAG: EamA family transporter [Ignavibacteria bacterium]|nr:EamA family transporter [Ignavibacteria bacterium]
MKKFIIFAYLIFSTSFTPIAAKVAVEQISPLSLAFFRFGLAAILFNLIFLIRRQSYKIDRKDIPMFLWLGALAIPINQFCFLKGVSFSNASHSGVIYSLTPLFAYLLSVKIKNENFSAKKLFIILLSITGIIIIFYENLVITNLTEGNVITGDILLVGAVFSWAAYLSYSKNMVEKYGAIKTSAIAFSTGIILYIPVLISDIKNLSFDKVNFYGILSFFHLSVLVAFLSYFIFVYSSKTFKVSNLTTYLNSSPAITIFFSWLILNEPLSELFIIGALITISGSILLQYICGNKEKAKLLNKELLEYE